MNTRKTVQALLLFFILLVPSVGCDSRTGGSDSEEKVSFIVPIQVEMFSAEATIRIRLWDAEQLEIMRKTANCAVSYNPQTQKEEVLCPEGIVYEKTEPEEFSFPIGEISEKIEVKSERLVVGETFRILISGLSNDECNSASADVEDTASSAQILLEDLLWSVTAMGCP